MDPLISSLAEAAKLKEEANNAYADAEYQKAIRLYHQCLLCAKGVVQLTSSGLQQLARAELNPEPFGITIDKNPKESEAEDDPVQVKEKISEEGASGSNSRIRLDSTSRGQEIRSEAKALITKCYNNLACCILAGGNTRTKEDFLRAVGYCDIVLKDEPDNEKAQFRKGLCLMKANCLEKAVEQFHLCKKNAQAKIHIHECTRMIEHDRQRRDDQIRANFAKARAQEEEALIQQQQQNGHNGMNAPPQPPPTMNGHVQYQ